VAASAARPSPILAAIDRMLAAPAPEKTAAPQPALRQPGPVITDSVARMDTNRGTAKVIDPFDQTVERIRSVFKGEIVP